MILIGSYAYGSPTTDSEVDLLIVKELTDAPVLEASRIRNAWWTIRLGGRNLGFDLLVEIPARHQERLVEGGSYCVQADEGRRSL